MVSIDKSGITFSPQMGVYRCSRGCVLNSSTSSSCTSGAIVLVVLVVCLLSTYLFHSNYKEISKVVMEQKSLKDGPILLFDFEPLLWPSHLQPDLLFLVKTKISLDTAKPEYAA